MTFVDRGECGFAGLDREYQQLHGGLCNEEPATGPPLFSRFGKPLCHGFLRRSLSTNIRYQLYRPQWRG